MEVQGLLGECPQNPERLQHQIPFFRSGGLGCVADRRTVDTVRILCTST